jgi:diaminohydroxyphosphoribosylaminopyrimidine deaminase / 5-amino-6-(5-phosphoribosylamino)uracil reductase
MSKIRSQELLWDILREINRQFKLDPIGLNLVTVEISPEGFHVIPNQAPSHISKKPVLVISLNNKTIHRENIANIFIDQDYSVHVLSNDILSNQDIEFLKEFLIFCLMPFRAYKLQRAVTVLHLAQSIDGRIATLSGSSKWLSNNENLVYVHRLRALCDGILIGSNTLEKDTPALTVRHVTGLNPVKIVIGNSAQNFDSLLASEDRIIHFTSQPVMRQTGIESICLDETSGLISPVTLLQKLYLLGIYSVYIEGGAFTASSFIKNKAVDIVNFFITPKILGSGLSLEFPGISKIEDSLCVSDCRFIPMGDGLLVTGTIKNESVL